MEFKESLPASGKLERTIIAFSNGGGGELYIGIKDAPRCIVGVPEDKLFKLEERIGNIIFENCYPLVNYDITFITVDYKNIVKVVVYPGGATPYYLKSLGKEQGTFIRVGSSNRLADSDIINELDRKKRNVSYDSVALHEFSYEDLNLNSFINLYLDSTGKKVDKAGLSKLGLVKQEHKKTVPTVAALLLCEQEIKDKMYPYAKIECARFKGTKTDTTIDSASINVSIAFQPDEAMMFIRRNIRKGSKIGAVYREERWEYPLPAIREIIINAVIHRDYSLLGKDIKVAIFDDMLEITSPGVMPSSIDISNLSGGQSEIRNRTLAPIFKELRLIEQWGTGFRKLSDELKDYPEIEIKFNEPGLAFQVQFILKYNIYSWPTSISPLIDSTAEPSQEQVGIKLALSKHQVSTKLALSREDIKKLLTELLNPVPISGLMTVLGWKDRTKFRAKFIYPLLEMNIIEMTVPDKPNSSRQKYLVTTQGKSILDELIK